MKKIIGFTTVILFTTLLFGQEIALPEVVTEIETQNEVAGAEIAPDFSDVFEQPSGSGNIVPELPEIEVQESKVASTEQQNGKNKIYAEGKLGGGFPSMIYGNFSIYELNPDSPFKVNFTHDSAAGYSRNSYNENYNDSLTSMNLEKSFKVKNFTFDFDGNYEAKENGLQNKVLGISEVTQDTMDGSGSFTWTLPNNFSLNSSLDLGFYNRFADINGTNEEIPDWTKQFMSFKLNPDFCVAYNAFGFDLDFRAQYLLNKEYIVSNRGEFGIDFAWHNDFVKTFANCSAVVGNTLNSNPVVVPFTVGVNSSFPVKFATNRFGINAQGGIESKRLSVADYEKLYNFTGFAESVNEVSEWYGNIEFIIPIQSIFTSSIKTEYRQTAFGNGRYVPMFDYEIPLFGLYSYDVQNVHMLTTDLNFMLNYKIFSLTAVWHSNWLDVPALESGNCISLNFALQGNKSLWNVNLYTAFFIDESMATPLITLSGMYRITEGVQLLASVEDMVNLIGGGSRTYAGQYISRSGCASIMVKFFF